MSGGKERRVPDAVLKLMVVATASLAAVSLSSVGLMHLLLPTFDRGNAPRHGGIDAPPAPTEASPPASAPAPGLSDSEESFSQEAFLELVKRRVNIKTPLDTTFWRPYVRGVAKDAGKNPAGNQTQLIFVAGAEGTGHHFITALMMRLSQLMPMTLVEEQMFQALWWNPKARDPAKFWSALESFQQWVQVRTHQSAPGTGTRRSGSMLPPRRLLLRLLPLIQRSPPSARAPHSRSRDRRASTPPSAHAHASAARGSSIARG